jgi:hypothetical protein
MKIKIILMFCIILMNINISSAMDISIFNIPNVITEQSFKYENNMYSEFKTIDNTDRITEIIIEMDNSFSNNTGIQINLSNNFTYSLVADKFTFLGLNTYMNINQSLIYNGYSIFNDSKTAPNFLNNKIKIDILYDDKTKQTIVREMHTSSITWNYLYETSNYIGMPSSDITIQGLSKFDAEIKVKDMSSQLSLNKNKLSLFTGVIYGILSFKFTIPLTNLSIGFGENETLLNVLLILDMFFFYISVFLTLLFTYPYLLIVWIFTIGNVFIAFKSNSIREMVFNFSVYYTYMMNKAYIIITYFIQIVIRIITAITNMIP